MRSLLNLSNTLLLLTSWLFALLGIYASLITGLKPTLAFGILLFWTALTWAAYRLAFSTVKRGYWRQAIPSLFFVLSGACFNYIFAFFQAKYSHEHGFPRRYYSAETKD